MVSRCIFCDSEVKEEKVFSSDCIRVECLICQTYIVSNTALEDKTIEEIPQRDRNLFSGYLRQGLAGRRPRFLSSDIVKIPDIVAPYRKLSVTDKINKVLSYLVLQSSSIGSSVSIDYLTSPPN